MKYKIISGHSSSLNYNNKKITSELLIQNPNFYEETNIEDTIQNLLINENVFYKMSAMINLITNI